MCGIAGVINNSSSISEHDLMHYASYVSFRGPNNTGIAVYDEYFRKSAHGIHGFFFNRLAILDLDERSNQPFEDDRYTLLFNGEIYNYLELKHELIIEGEVFKTTSDTEVLFKGLIQRGCSFIDKLNGMFAFAFIDRQEQTFLLARDRMGIKPLCYSLTKQGSLVFASELDSIKRLSEDTSGICKTAVSLFLAFQYVPTPFTIYEGIYKLPPGTFIEGEIKDLAEHKTLFPKTYWSVEDALKKQYSEISLESLLVNSIKLQLQSDVPLGLFLSSGVDSSLLAAVVNKHFRNGQKFNFFTIAFETKTISDESDDAERFLNAFSNPNFLHHKLYVNPDVLKQAMLTMYDYLDEPFGDPAVILNSGISQKAREYVTVTLSGDGADELFWGYPRYNEWINTRLSFMRNNWFYSISPLFGLFPNRIKQSLKYRTETDPMRIYLAMVTSCFRDLDDIMETGCWGLNIPSTLQSRDDLPFVIDAKNYLPDCMFYKVDRSSMGASLEVRVPYLDNSIIDYGLSLPLEKKSNDKFKNKALLKELLQKLAPHYNINQQKKGFNFPLKQWLTSDWKDLFYATISVNNLAGLGLDRSLVKLLDAHYYRHIDHTTELWHLFNLLYWKEYKSGKYKLTEMR